MAEYWIVNLGDRQIEVHWEPMAAPAVLFGRRYGQRQVLRSGE